MSDVERLLRSRTRAGGPAGAAERAARARLTELTEAAADEIADWELSAMRDPRRWARPAAAGVIGSVAAGALVARASAPEAEEARGHRPERSQKGDPRASRTTWRSGCAAKYDAAPRAPPAACLTTTLEQRGRRQRA